MMMISRPFPASSQNKCGGAICTSALLNCGVVVVSFPLSYCAVGGEGEGLLEGVIDSGKSLDVRQMSQPNSLFRFMAIILDGGC
jgi:hypothetical protein